MKIRMAALTVSVPLLCSFAHGQWVQTALTSVRVNTIVAKNGDLFAGTNGNGVYVSTNNGLNWGAVNNGLTNTVVRSLCVVGTDLFAGTYGGGVFRSTDHGSTWTSASSGVANPYVLSLTVSGATLFAGTEFAAGGIFRSTNNGSTWSLANTGMGSMTVRSLAASGTNLFAGTNGGGVYASTNNGLAWSAVNNGITNTYIPSLGVNGSRVFAGSESGLIYVSTNNGAQWSGVTVGSVSGVNSFAFSGTNVFAGAAIGGVSLSTNNGSTWGAINTGLAETTILSLVVKGDTLYAGTFSSGVWRRPLQEVATSADMVPPAAATQFALAQNYPNPFNPSTTIRFDLPHPERVTLAVYDAVGREIARLAEGAYPAGVHSVVFDATGISSGVYFYRMTAGSFTEVRKLLLMK
jgi:hypothetical protein